MLLMERTYSVVILTKHFVEQRINGEFIMQIAWLYQKPHISSPVALLSEPYFMVYPHNAK